MSSEQVTFVPGVEQFIYRNFAGSDGAPAPVDLSIFEQGRHPGGWNPAAPSSLTELEIKKREAAAYDQGLNTGRAELRGEMELTLAQTRQTLAENLKKFDLERDQYYRRIEGEIVDLALAVSRKILHREAQVDRVVLSGVVRVALDKISNSNRVVLFVHPSAAEAWREFIAAQRDFTTTPEIQEDGSLRPGQLILKTDHGSSDLGIDAQFTEIEKGFADLVQQKQRSLKP